MSCAHFRRSRSDAAYSRPLGAVEVSGRATAAERILPPPSWAFNETAALTALDQVLSLQPSTGIRSVFKKTQLRRPTQLDASTVHLQSVVRRHAAGYIEKRDAEIRRSAQLNRRMNFLVTESNEWQTQYAPWFSRASFAYFIRAVSERSSPSPNV